MSKIIRSVEQAIGEIDIDSLTNLLSCAFEGGITYWAKLDYNSEEYRKSKENIKKTIQVPCWEEVLSQMLLDGYSLRIIDAEDGEESEYTKNLTLENLKDGLRLDFLNSHLNFEGANNWHECDGEEADHIIQFALFNDIIFG